MRQYQALIRIGNFEGCGLEVEGNIPRLLRKKKANYGYDLIFTLPAGLSSKQFEQKKTEIEEYMNGSIEISVKNKTNTTSLYKAIEKLL